MKYKKSITAGAAGALLVAVSVFSLSTGRISTLLQPAYAAFERAYTPEDQRAPEDTTPQVEHQQTPKAVKAVYMSQCAAASSELRQHILSLIADTELNAVVVDVKDFSGTVVFPSEHAIAGGVGCTTGDFRALVKEMHERGIYVIGRVTVFQDPLYTKTNPQWAVKRRSNTSLVWKDYKGLSFVDVGARPFWDYIIAIAKEAHAMGVDELNFDYIRYPSDGNMQDVYYEHTSGTDYASEMERFFSYLSRELRRESGGHTPVLSADLFGMTTTNYDDLSIGQVLERALPYFDYIAPMVYPSHYPPRFNGLANPNEHVYEVVKYSMDSAVERVLSTTTPVFSHTAVRMGTSTPAVYAKPAYPANVLRPWLQDFDYGGNYGSAEVRAQIQATYDAGLNSWMLWDPSNRYTREALKVEQ